MRNDVIKEMNIYWLQCHFLIKRNKFEQYFLQNRIVKKLKYLQIKASSRSRIQTLRSLEYSLFSFLPGRHTCFCLFHLRSWRKYSKLCLTSSPKQNSHQARWSSEKRQTTTEWKNTLGRTPWNLLCVFMWPVFSMYCLNNEYFLKVLTDV